MKILVTGSRDWKDAQTIAISLWNAYKRAGSPCIMTVVHGAARGADFLAGAIARHLGWGVVEHPADWASHGRAAGPIRNQAMLDSHQDIDLCLAFPLPGSIGTLDMVHRCELKGVPTLIVPPGSVKIS